MKDIKIRLPYKFIKRGYQQPLHDYMVTKTDLGNKFKDRRAGKRACMVWHRRTGKDKTCFADNIVPAMFERVGAYHYYFPTATDGRSILWDGIDRDGMAFLDHFPKELIKNKNNQEMKIIARNGSLFQIIGSDRQERVGTNPIGCVFSEFSKQNPHWWDLVRPILAENAGWAIFNWTPRGKNHAYRMDRMARTNDKWFYQFLTVDDTNAIDQRAIDEDRASGMSEEMIQQEYYCSYNTGVEGSYYGRMMGKLWQLEQIRSVPYDSNHLVHTAWDLGYGDSTAIWFYQQVVHEIRVIDYYENYGEGINHYVRVLSEKKEKEKYLYGQHFAPHDVKSGSLQTGRTLQETAEELGIKFVDLPRENHVDEGIERVRRLLGRCWFDAKKCEQGINALENYHKPYNEKNNAYGVRPVHDWSSHGADAFRYLSASVDEIGSPGMTKEQYIEMKRQYA